MSGLFNITDWPVNATAIGVSERTELVTATVILNSARGSDWLWNPITWYWWVIIQLMLALVGLCGNLLVLLILIHRRSFRKPTDILIGGLAASDMLTSIFMVPQPKLAGVPDSSLGHAACKLIYSSIFLWISITSSVFTLTAIAIERYLAVLYPIQFKRWVTPKRLVLWFTVIWLSAIVLNSRTFGTTWVDADTRTCTLQYRSPILQTLSGIAVFLILYVIPTCIMLTCYSLIARCLHQRASRYKTHHNTRRPGDSSGASDSLGVARYKVIKLMFIVIVTFIVCWTADSIGLLAYNMRWVDKSYLYSPLYHVLVVLAFFNTCANPLIYAIRYPEFRAAAKDLVSCSKAVRESLFGRDYNQGGKARGKADTVL